MHKLLSTWLILSVLWPVALWADMMEPPQIVVTGHGQIAAIPDIARIELGAEARAESAAEAMRDVQSRIVRMLDALETIGFEARDVQTSAVSLYRRNDPKRKAGGIIGEDDFVASASLRVTLRDVSQLGEVLDDILDAGGTHLHGFQLDLSNERPFKDQARKAAVADAQVKAALYAEAAGVTLGPILSLREGGAEYGGGQHMMMRAEASGMPVAPGETQVTAAVTLVYEVLQ